MDLHARLLSIVVPGLLLLAVLELVYALLSKRGVHSFRDTVSSVALGIGQQTINVYLTAAFLAVFALAHERFAIFHADRHAVWQWVVLIFAADLCYYCGHRTAHTVNLFVGSHIVHHHAEDFNLLSALRQSWTAWALMFPFFLPLAVVGYPLDMLVYAQLGIMIFQFLSHTGARRFELGLLDRIFITPKNHRVHHGYGRRYGRANCGGMFVIWDRIFGTYVEEDAANPLKIGAGISFNFYDPFAANFDYFRRLAFVSRRRSGLASKISIWFSSPLELRQELDRLGYVAAPSNRGVLRAPMSGSERALVASVLVATLALFVAHRLLYGRVSIGMSLLLGGAAMCAIWLLGRLLSADASKSGGASARGSGGAGPSTEDLPVSHSVQREATSLPETGSRIRTSTTPRAHRAAVSGKNPKGPSAPSRRAAPRLPELETRRTPCKGRSGSPSPRSGRSARRPASGSGA